MQPIELRGRLTLLIGSVLTLGWAVSFALYIESRIGWGGLGALSPGEQGGLIAGLTAPLALIWMVLGYFKRSHEIAQHTAALQDELSRLRDPLGDAQAESSRIADALRERLELVESATAAADGQLTGAARLLEDQAQAIGAAAAKVVGEVEQARQGLSEQREVLEEQSGEAMRLMREQVEEIERRIAAAGERLEQQSAAFAAGAEAARRTLSEPIEVLA